MENTSWYILEAYNSWSYIKVDIIPNNNRAETVLSRFRATVISYGFPKRIRLDRGGENQHVARLMLETVGINSLLTESSVHNQRIERLWRDVDMAVIRILTKLFRDMEDNGLLNVEDETQLFLLCTMYLYLELMQRLNPFKMDHIMD